MNYKRWMIAAAFALALGACRTTSEKRASTDQASGSAATAQNTDTDRRQTQHQDPQDAAAEQAPSTRPQEGAGGHNPHPLPTPAQDDPNKEVYSGNAPQEPSMEGRVPESRQGDAQASAQGSTSGTAATGTGSTGDTGASASAGTGDVGASGSVGSGGAGASAGTGDVGASGSVGAGSGDASASMGGTGSGAAGSTASPSEVTGRVALVDKNAHEIAIDSGTATTQVKVAKDAQILVNGSKGKFDDIKQGAQVRASLNQAEGTQEATRIEVTSKAKK